MCWNGTNFSQLDSIQDCFVSSVEWLPHKKSFGYIYNSAEEWIWPWPLTTWSVIQKGSSTLYIEKKYHLINRITYILWFQKISHLFFCVRDLTHYWTIHPRKVDFLKQSHWLDIYILELYKVSICGSMQTQSLKDTLCRFCSFKSTGNENVWIPVFGFCFSNIKYATYTKDQKKAKKKAVFHWSTKTNFPFKPPPIHQINYQQWRK